jgi:alkylation response protein AidB-like acyl-CoA dehydrogenase
MGITAESPVNGPALASVLAEIAGGASDRDRERTAPHAEIARLRETGLGALRVPTECGGAGASVRQLFEVLVDVAHADSNIAQILRAHFGYVEVLLLTPPSPERDGWLKRIAEGELVGNAITEASGAHAGDFVGLGTTFTPDGDGFRISGTKYYSTGTLYADHVWVWGVTPDGLPASAVVPTGREGVDVIDDWDGFGQRLTGTGTTTFDDVRAEASEVTLTDPAVTPPRVPLGAFLQLWLTATIAGNLHAIEDDAVALLRRRTRSFTHGSADLPKDDPNFLQVVGELSSNAWGARAAVLGAADAIDRALAALGAGDFESGASEEAAIRAAAAKIVVDRLSQRSASLLFETGGASATKQGANLDRHWRNVRTLASHNPTTLKARVLGDHAVNGTELPDNTYF